MRCLGHGGMGVVYEALDREGMQRVALKTLLQLEDPAAIYRFKQEFRALADVRHPNLVQLYELVLNAGEHAFFTMELVDGRDFLEYVHGDAGPRPDSSTSDVTVAGSGRRSSLVHSEVLRSEPSDHRKSPADFDRLRAALRQLATGVQALHTTGTLHRDLKPSNVLVAHDGRVVILDFGVSTQILQASGADENELVGTARYMAPEQGNGDAPRAAADWYSVGVMLYEALVGSPPFRGASSDVLTMKSTMDPLPPAECVPDVPSDLDALCRALLKRDPSERPEGSEILDSLGVRPSVRLLKRAKGKATKLVGREDHLRALREAFDASRSGHPVAVWVPGSSGAGKSSLTKYLVDELEQGGEALVLRARAYERESVPFKAIDGLIDSLSRHLIREIGEGRSVALPPDIHALARLFPVLQRVSHIGPTSEEPNQSVPRRRARAFGALRELLANVARQGLPLVICVDDVHWGDVDSAALLLDLMRGPAVPPLLLMMTYRDNEEDTSAFLLEAKARWPTLLDTRTVSVGGLDSLDSYDLALSLLGETNEQTRKLARAIARESHGNPFLIEELVRGNQRRDRRDPGVSRTLSIVTIEDVVGDQIDALPGAARRLVEVIAIAGHPIAVSVAVEAAGIDQERTEVLDLLSGGTLVRIGMRDGHDVIEIVHDRIREAIVGLMPERERCAYHLRLADVLEARPDLDIEGIAVHLFAAGMTDRAATFALRAAEEAAGKLALDRAARHFRMAIEARPSSPETYRWRLRLAGLLEEQGQCDAAARVYMEAAQDAPADQRMELQHTAAEKLMMFGHIAEGGQALRSALEGAGMKAPRTALGALFWLVVYRAWLFVRGLRFVERDPEAISREQRMRVDALYAASFGFASANVVLGACLQARHLLEALRFGDRFQVMRAAALEAVHLAIAGGAETKRESELSALADRLGSATLEGQVFSKGARGVSLFLRRRFRQALDTLTLLDGMLPNQRAGWHSNGYFFAGLALFNLGDYKALARTTPRLYADAKECGDLYTTVSLATSTQVAVHLMNDDPDSARRDAREAMAQWPRTDFLMQHWQDLVHVGLIDLYVGDSGRAYDQYVQQMPALRKSLLLYSECLRHTTWAALGRVTIASIEVNPELRDSRIAATRRLARKLGRGRSPVDRAAERLLTALADNASGNREGAASALRQVIEQADGAVFCVPVNVVRYRLGQLLGGEEGDALKRQAADEMSQQGIVNLERWVAMMLPGRWEQAHRLPGPSISTSGSALVRSSE